MKRNNFISKTMLSYAVISFALILVSCGGTETNTQNQTTESKTEAAFTTYTNQEIGWTLQIPKEWPETIKENFELNGNKYMLALMKSQTDPINYFTSSADFIGDIENEEAYIKNVGDDIVSGFSGGATEAETFKYEISKETVDNKNFTVYSCNYYNADNSFKSGLIMYFSIINKNEVILSISFDNDSDKEIMLTMLKNSKFTK